LNFGYFFLAIFFSITNIILKIYRWYYLSELFQKSISWQDASIITLSSFFYANITPGKIGDLFKAYYMRAKYGLNLLNGISMIFFERLFEIIILFFCALLIVSREIDNSTIIILQFTAVLIILLIVFYYKSEWIVNVLSKILVKITDNDRFNISFSLQKISPCHVAIVFLITFLSLICEFVRLWLVVAAFGFIINPWDIAIIFSISIIFGLISQIPLGIGVMEGSLSFLLERLGIPIQYSVPIVLIDRMISMYLVLVVGFIVSHLSWNELRKLKPESP
jgi:uncharacterized protein (TIRG00374 family)